MPQMITDSYPLTDTIAFGRGLSGPAMSKNKANRTLRSASIRDNKQIRRERQVQKEQPPRSYLVPMRWEKYSCANQLAVSQLLRVPKPRTNVYTSTASNRLQSIRQHCMPHDSVEKPVRDQPISTFSSCAASSLGREAQLQLARFKSGSYGAAGLVASGKGYSQWYRAFEDLMEDLLEDAEDVLLNIPYTAIREALTYSKEILDDTAEARLSVRIPDQSKGLLVTRSGSGLHTVGSQNFSYAIWADPDFDISRRSLISERSKQILYSLHDAIRELVEAYYYPQITLHDSQPRKKLIRCLDELGSYLEPARGQTSILRTGSSG